jgi:FkbM family methyltransferase
MRGWLRRVQSAMRRRPKTPLVDQLQRMLVPGRVINIVQVGANDGVINDPLYDFVRSHARDTRIILVEPQAALIPILTRAYAFHPAKAIVQAAIGPLGTLVLHRVRPECWGDLVVPYATGWPPYRAPTGVTSARLETVLDWLGRHYRGPLAATEVVEAVEVEAVDMPALLARAGMFRRPDVLVIDAEGYDDHVIAASDIAGLRPRLIQFEAMHLGAARLAAVTAQLVALGYRVRRHGMDALAVREQG